jgi:Protein of unknown function (DUF1579)
LRAFSDSARGPESCTIAKGENNGKRTSANRSANHECEPQKEHEWLHKLVGDWTYETVAPPEPGKPATKATGAETAGDGNMTKYEDIIEFKSDDHRVLTARMLAPDGTWQQLMSVDYRRRNK